MADDWTKEQKLEYVRQYLQDQKEKKDAKRQHALMGMLARAMAAQDPDYHYEIEPYEQYYIYGLIDESTKEIRYIGKTNDLNARLKQHIQEAKRYDTPKTRWIRDVLNKGQKIGIVILESVPDGSLPEDREQLWIDTFYDQWSLSNSRVYRAHHSPSWLGKWRLYDDGERQDQYGGLYDVTSIQITPPPTKFEGVYGYPDRGEYGLPTSDSGGVFVPVVSEDESLVEYLHLMVEVLQEENEKLRTALQAQKS